uniref:Ribosomal protein S10 n=1 Tax=Pleurosigma inscriptura TaxID=2819025 RepID=A0A8A3SRJ3_9STRA|nr:ribosomal protein S10 [Pleurosigma inscriptura]QSZ78230.1 ribosomal protein S10 [Pleurosigma inscriptura]
MKKIVTLKSPHVNKKSQNQLEYRIFSKKISVSSYNEIKFLIFLKNLKTKLFSEIKFKIKILSNPIFFKNNNLLNLKNYYINSIMMKKNAKMKKIKPCSKMKNYLKILDCYGELNSRILKN